MIANGPAFAGVRRAVASLGEPDIGLHLNLSEGAPLLPLGALTELFPEGLLSAAAIHAQPRHQDAIVQEWMAQVRRARAEGLEPTHLDTHQHVHWRPVLLGALRRVASESGVRRVRTMGGFRPDADPARRLLQRARAARFTRALRRGAPPLITTDHFASAQVFRALLERGQAPRGVIEVMAHPGNDAHPHYGDELRWLAGPWDQGLAFPIARISWRQVR